MGHDVGTLLLAVATIALWGFWGFLGKVALDRGVPPMNLFLFEAAAGAACALVVAVTLVSARSPVSTPWNVFGIASGVAMAAGLVTFYLALERASASLVVPLTAIYPLVAVSLSQALLGERLAAHQWAGVTLIVAGTGFLLYQQR